MQDIIKGFDTIRRWVHALSWGIHESGCVHALMLKIETFAELRLKLGLINKGYTISVTLSPRYLCDPMHGCFIFI